MIQSLESINLLGISLEMADLIEDRVYKNKTNFKLLFDLTILNYYNFLVSPTQINQNKLISNLDRLIDEIYMNNGEIPIGLSYGITGIALIYFQTEKKIGYKNKRLSLKKLNQLIIGNINYQIEQYPMITEMFNNRYFDLISGLSGIGLYFLKNGETQFYRKIFDLLFATFNFEKQSFFGIFNNYFIEREEIINPKIKNICFKNDYTKYIDFSMSHGVMGVIHFLFKVFEKDSTQTRERKMKIIFKELNTIFYEYGFSLVYYFDKNQIVPAQRVSKSWAYGISGCLKLIKEMEKQLNIENVVSKQMLEEVKLNENYGKIGLQDISYFSFSTGIVSMIYLNNKLGVKDCGENKAIKIFLFDIYQQKKIDFNNISYLSGIVSILVPCLIINYNLNDDLFDLFTGLS